MGRFAANAIGLYLDVDDTMSPKLGKAERNYKRFTTSLDTLNRKAVSSVKKGMGALAGIVQQFEDMPKIAEQAVAKTMSRLARGKPLSIPVELVFGGKQGVSGVLRAALKDMVIRMSPTMPGRRSAAFEGGSIRAQYRSMPQPPDYIGRVKRMATGGVVGGAAGRDRVPAMLTRGELVIPADLTRKLLSVMSRQAGAGAFDGGIAPGRGGRAVQAMLGDARYDPEEMTAHIKKLTGKHHLMGVGPKGQGFVSLSAENLGATVAYLNDMLEGLPRLREVAESGMDPEAPALFADAMRDANASLISMQTQISQLAPPMKRALIPMMNKLGKELHYVGQESKKDIDVMESLLRKTLSPVRFIAAMTALRAFREAGTGAAAVGAGRAWGISGKELAGTAAGGVPGMVQTLGVGRGAAFGLMGEAAEAGRAKGLGHVPFAEGIAGLNALNAAGMRDKKMATELAFTVAGLSRAVGLGPDSLAATLQEVTGRLGMSGDEATAFIMSLREINKATTTSIEALSSGVRSLLEEDQSGVGMLISGMADPAAKRKVLHNAAMLYGILGDQFIQSFDLPKIISESMNPNNPNYSTALNALENLTGSPAKVWEESLKSGEFTSVVKKMQAALQGINAQVGGTDTSEGRLRAGAAAESYGFTGGSPQFVQLLNAAPALGQSLGKLSGTFLSTAAAQKELASASRDTQNWFEALQASIGTKIVAAGGAGLLSAFDSLHMEAIAATIYFGKQLWIPISGLAVRFGWLAASTVPAAAGLTAVGTAATVGTPGILALAAATAALGVAGAGIGWGVGQVFKGFGELIHGPAPNISIGKEITNLVTAFTNTAEGDLSQSAGKAKQIEAIAASYGNIAKSMAGAARSTQNVGAMFLEYSPDVLKTMLSNTVKVFDGTDVSVYQKTTAELTAGAAMADAMKNMARSVEKAAGRVGKATTSEVIAKISGELSEDGTTRSGGMGALVKTLVDSTKPFQVGNPDLEKIKSARPAMSIYAEYAKELENFTTSMAKIVGTVITGGGSQYGGGSEYEKMMRAVEKERGGGRDLASGLEKMADLFMPTNSIDGEKHSIPGLLDRIATPLAGKYDNEGWVTKMAKASNALWEYTKFVEALGKFVVMIDSFSKGPTLNPESIAKQLFGACESITKLNMARANITQGESLKTVVAGTTPATELAKATLVRVEGPVDVKDDEMRSLLRDLLDAVRRQGGERVPLREGPLGYGGGNVDPLAHAVGMGMS